MGTIVKFLPLLLTLSVTLQCRQTNSNLNQLFGEQQRRTITIAEAPYIFRIDSGCTAFIIDKTKGIAISADHCGPEVGQALCWGAPQLRDPNCAYPARIVQHLEGPAQLPDTVQDK